MDLFLYTIQYPPPPSSFEAAAAAPDTAAAMPLLAAPADGADGADGTGGTDGMDGRIASRPGRRISGETNTGARIMLGGSQSDLT